ncbi:MAG: HIT family protein [Bacteroidales bacterium]|nr:HIT family protein [Bacteroidales bacterium]
MPSIFTRIVNGEIPCYKIAEDDQFLAFLDINPLAKGHTLVIPKKEIDYLFDIDDDQYRDMWLFSKKVALAVEKVVPCQRIGIAVLGLEVPHAHIHLVPINSVYDIDFSKPKLKLSQEEFQLLAGRITGEYAKAGQ